MTLKPVIHLDRSGQAPFIGWAGEVNTFAELPPAIDNVGLFYMVLNATGTRFLLNYKASGLYRSEGGSWIKKNDVGLYLNDDQFAVYNAADNSKMISFDVSGITTGTKRTATWQNSDGLVAWLSDIITSHNALSGIQGGAAADYNHLTTAELTVVQAIDQVYTLAEKNKLSGIQALAQVNVQSDWNAVSGDAFILNKPTIPTVLKTKSGIVAAVTFVGNPLRATVTFTTPFADANYSISLIETTNANRNFNMKVDSAPTAAGFTISMGSENNNNLVDVRWIAIKNGEN